MNEFPVLGKIEEEFFESRVFPHLGQSRDEVVVGPGYGVDCAVIELPGEQAMGITSDPLTFIPALGLRESAWLSIVLATNDLATTGVPPMYGQFVLNMPGNVQGADFQKYWSFISEYCERFGIAITGGHTGRFDGQYSTVCGGVTLFNFGPKEDILTTRSAQPGDDVILIGDCALSSTSILSRSYPSKIAEECGEKVQKEAADMFFELSTVEICMSAADFHRKNGGLTSMHDVTEGGILGAIYELSEAADAGVDVQQDKIQPGNAQKEICKLFNIDPYFCIGSGAVLLTCAPEVSKDLIAYIRNEHDTKAAICGRLLDKEEGKTYTTPSGKKLKLKHPGTDPYWSAYFEAAGNGWQ